MAQAEIVFSHKHCPPLAHAFLHPTRLSWRSYLSELQRPTKYSLTPSRDVELCLVRGSPGVCDGRHVVEHNTLDEHPQEHGRLSVFDQRVECVTEERLRRRRRRQKREVTWGASINEIWDCLTPSPLVRIWN